MIKVLRLTGMIRESCLTLSAAYCVFEEGAKLLSHSIFHLERNSQVDIGQRNVLRCLVKRFLEFVFVIAETLVIMKTLANVGWKRSL